jgi:FkbM family methyltransferase
MLKNTLNFINILKNNIVSRYPGILQNRLFLHLRVHYQELKYLITGEETVIGGCYGARAYFKKNKNKIDTIVSSLQDDESKKTYLNIIEYRKMEFFRQLFQKKGISPVYHGYENQYFVNDFFKYGENEILVDCGAYTGDSIEVFSKVAPNFSKIIALEPDINNFRQLQENHKEEKKIFLINAGAWEKNDSLNFSIAEEWSYSSHLSKNSTEKTISVNVLALDTIEEIKKSKITFIKMDIEGAELEALRGAKETIKKDKPRLAICLYHYNRHFVEIPEYIHSIVPEYKFWIRHHNREYPHETVLYTSV